MKESFDFWGTPEGDVVHPADCMHQVLEKVRRHKVNIDGNVCTVMVTTLVLEVISFYQLYEPKSIFPSINHKRKNHPVTYVVYITYGILDLCQPYVVSKRVNWFGLIGLY